jgi:hypothetical protein
MPTSRSSPAGTPIEQASEFGFKGALAGFEQSAFGYGDDVETWSYFITAENVSNQSFSSISLDRAAELPSRRDPQAADVKLVAKQEERNQLPVTPDPLGVHPLEIVTATNSLAGPEVSRGCRHQQGTGSGRSGAYRLLTVSRLRPLARRRLRTRRPFLVLIRTRNP